MFKTWSEWRIAGRKMPVTASTITSNERTILSTYGVVWNTQDADFEPNDLAKQTNHAMVAVLESKGHWYAPSLETDDKFFCFETEREAFDALIRRQEEDEKLLTDLGQIEL